jgi:leucyl aminopeptidase (aminopeptidase T)
LAIAQEIWKFASQISTGACLLQLPGDWDWSQQIIDQSIQHADLVLFLVPLRNLPFPLLKKWSAPHRKIGVLPTNDVGFLARTLSVNYAKMDKLSRRIAEILSIGKKLRIEDGNGGFLEASIQHAKGQAFTGSVEKGQLTFLPGGRALIVPMLEHCSGRIVLDGAISDVGLVKGTVQLFFRDGRLVRISGGEDAQRLRKYLRTEKIPSKYLTWISVGTNHHAKVCGSLHEDELSLGRIQIAIGEPGSEGMPDLSRPYARLTLKKSRLLVDGRLLVDNGKICK